jgi:hypothetical protein
MAELVLAAPQGVPPHRPVAELVGISTSPWSPTPPLEDLTRAGLGRARPRRDVVARADP